jgi:adenine-specific DNA-methyltransferase
MDEVFGSDNFVSIITMKKSGGMGQFLIDNISDFLLWYAKDKTKTKYRQLFIEKNLSEGAGSRYNQVELSDLQIRPILKQETIQPGLLPGGSRVFLGGPLTSETPSNTTVFSFDLNNKSHFPKKGGWKTNLKGMTRLIEANRLFNTKAFVNYKIYFDDFRAVKLPNLWDDTMGTAEQNKIYVVQTVKKVIERCLLMTTDPGDLVLDPTCGSGTTAYVAEQWGRRWITIDTSRVALALARTRIMSARFPYYLLADSPEGLQKEADVTGQRPPAYETRYDIKKGFVYDRVPRITIESRAKSEKIEPIYAKWQEKMGALRAEINEKSRKTWEAWELPREYLESADVNALLQQWWELRLKRQKEIDENISRRAEMELLYDKPFEDPKRVRVTGPFTVESLSPHRILPADEDMNGTVSEEEARKQQDYATIILDNLRAAGVQNTVKNERIKFDFLEPHPGKWIHAQGTYTDLEGTPRRVAISLGPEHGTVGPLQLKEAAKEAVQGIGFDMLLVCGFAFDPHVTEDAKHYGKLTVLPTKMNPDLSMGDDLLKKTGAGNLFMIFGDPDIEIRKEGQDSFIVEIKGVDVYDPTTGQIRNSSTEDIACWFIDTDYNE